MLDPDNRHPAIADATDQRDELSGFLFGKPARDFVQQQQSRLARERARQFKALAVEKRQRARRLVFTFRKSAFVKYLRAFRIRSSFASSTREHCCNEQVFERRPPRIGAWYLVGAPYSAARPDVGRNSRQALTSQQEVTRIGPLIAAYQVEQGRLASAIRPEHTNQFSIRHLEIEICHDP
jgi:hypothetical protein